jgi:outer membrane protein assembly factor BamE (lipoprotein component of BamABCDE complex)
VAAAAALAALAGCATTNVSQPAGRDYAQAAFQQFVLDRTTVAEAEAVLGPPMRQSSLQGMAKPGATLVAPGSTLKLTTLQYYFAPNGFGKPANLHPAKAAIMLFLGDSMIGYSTVNAIPGEVTPPVDEDRLALLHQGQTTRADVIGLFGTPTAQLLHRFTAQDGSSEISYAWARQSGDTITQRTVRIFFDRVTRLTSYAVVNNSFPATSVPLLQFGPRTGAPASPGMPHPIQPADREHT